MAHRSIWPLTSFFALSWSRSTTTGFKPCLASVMAMASPLYAPILYLRASSSVSREILLSALASMIQSSGPIGPTHLKSRSRSGKRAITNAP
ncbi:hypothetical protein D3C84_990040 [compost metagenome]